MDEVIKSNIPDVVLQAVVMKLQNTFGEALHTKKFAVRSSATGNSHFYKTFQLIHFIMHSNNPC